MTDESGGKQSFIGNILVNDRSSLEGAGIFNPTSVTNGTKT